MHNLFLDRTQFAGTNQICVTKKIVYIYIYKRDKYSNNKPIVNWKPTKFVQIWNKRIGLFHNEKNKGYRNPSQYWTGVDYSTINNIEGYREMQHQII